MSLSGQPDLPRVCGEPHMLVQTAEKDEGNTRQFLVVEFGAQWNKLRKNKAG